MTSLPAAISPAILSTLLLTPHTKSSSSNTSKSLNSRLSMSRRGTRNPPWARNSQKNPQKSCPNLRSTIYLQKFRVSKEPYIMKTFPKAFRKSTLLQSLRKEKESKSKTNPLKKHSKNRSRHLKFLPLWSLSALFPMLTVKSISLQCITRLMTGMNNPKSRTSKIWTFRMITPQK